MIHLEAALLVVSLLLAAPPSPGSSAGVTLVSDGQARARIVVQPQAGKVAAFAARELQAYVEKATRARLPIEEQCRGDGTAEVVLGAGPAARAEGMEVESLPRDGFRIRGAGEQVFIAGRDDPDLDLEKNLDKLGVPVGKEWATLFGVYEFLERYVGVRWYLPVDLGEVVPKTADLVVPMVDLTDAPAKLYRDTSMDFGADDVPGPLPRADSHVFVPDFHSPDQQRAFYRRRNLWSLRLRYGTAVPPASHTLWQIVNPARYLKDDPELFALGPDGERLAAVDDPAHAQHCYSNPDLAATVLKAARAFFSGAESTDVGLPGWRGIGLETPLGKVFHIAPTDGYQGCLCDRCQAFRRDRVARGEAAEDIERELVLSFLKAVARGVAKKFPHGFVSTSAYGPLATPPREKLPSNLLVLKLAVEGPYAELVPEVMRYEESVLRDWQAVGDTRFLSFYHYPNAAGFAHRYRLGRGISGSIPRAYAACYRRYGSVGVGTRLFLQPHNIVQDHLNIYVFYKAHWNPQLDVDALLREYYTLLYGPAAGPMGRFWEEVEAQFRQVPVGVVSDPIGPQVLMHDELTLWSRIYGPDVRARWQSYFQEAEKKAGADSDPVYAERVAYVKRNTLDLLDEEARQRKDLLPAARSLGIADRWVSVPLKNPGFEEPVDGRGWTQWKRDPADVHFERDVSSHVEGKASGSLRGSCVLGGFIQVVPNVACGTVYRFAFACRSQLKQGRLRYQAVLTRPLPDGSHFWAQQRDLNPEPGWRLEETPFFVPVPVGKAEGDPVPLKLALQAVDMEPGDQVWFDAVSLSRYVGAKPSE